MKGKRSRPSNLMPGRVSTTFTNSASDTRHLGPVLVTGLSYRRVERASTCRPRARDLTAPTCAGNHWRCKATLASILRESRAGRALERAPRTRLRADGFPAGCHLGCEGIVSAGLPLPPGRSLDWLKLRTRLRRRLGARPRRIGAGDLHEAVLAIVSYLLGSCPSCGKESFGCWPCRSRGSGRCRRRP